MSFPVCNALRGPLNFLNVSSRVNTYFTWIILNDSYDILFLDYIIKVAWHWFLDDTDRSGAPAAIELKYKFVIAGTLTLFKLSLLSILKDKIELNKP